jgi:proton glutamate symport protein
VSLTARVLAGLVAGFVLGLFIAGSGNATLGAIPDVLTPVGTLWVNGLRMIVIPLVVSAVLVGVTSLPDLRTLGRIGGRGLVLCLIILVVAASYAVLVGPILMSQLTIDPAAAAALRVSAESASAEAVQSAKRVTGAGQWLVDFVPTNPVKAAADGAMLPLIVFTVVVGLASARIGAEQRASLVNAAEAVLAASMVIVRWVLALAPIGVFALTVPVATRLGLAAAGAVLYYVAVVSAMCMLFSLLLYVVAWAIGGQPFRTFARACAPAQAVAMSTRSSLVALPAMLEGADKLLRLPLPVRSFFLPLSVAVLRTGSAIMLPVGVLFMARLYGIELGSAQLATVALMSIVTTFTIPSIPGGTVIVMVPVLLAADLPVSAVGLLLAVDTIPDMVRTVTHVTADMAAATVLGRMEWLGTESNRRHADFQSAALPTELPSRATGPQN